MEKLFQQLIASNQQAIEKHQSAIEQEELMLHEAKEQQARLLLLASAYQNAVESEVRARTLPEHLTPQQICNYLDISRPTFYREVYKKILHPVEEVGKRPYYLLKDLNELMKCGDIQRHEKGSWTFAKRNRSKKRPKS